MENGMDALRSLFPIDAFHDIPHGNVQHRVVKHSLEIDWGSFLLNTRTACSPGEQRFPGAIR